MSRSPDEYATSAFDYALPDELIAAYPAQQRDHSRLLVLNRKTGALAHRTFRDLIDLIPFGDALVLNETRVLPARLLGTRAGGGAAEVLLLRPLAENAASYEPAAMENSGAIWEALVRPGAKLKQGRIVTISDELRVELVDGAGATRIVRLLTELPIREAIRRYGHMPLPPYITRPDSAADAERYQTVFARTEGSVAAPTASLHFTKDLLAALEARGVLLPRVVLHVGIGTFRPVEVEDPAQHSMHHEYFEVPAATAEALNRTRERGARIWAAGTTVARTLETIADEQGHFEARAGWTNLFIRPGYHFRAIDRLITNFHLPRSTLLMLVAAFGGYEHVMNAYRSAIAQKYRFYSYGDAMVILDGEVNGAH